MWHVGSSSLTRDRTWDPALGAQGLSHWTTRKVSFTESWVEERRIESFIHNQMGPSKNKKILLYSSPYTQCPPHFPPWPRLDHDLTWWRLFFWKEPRPDLQEWHSDSMTEKDHGQKTTAHTQQCWEHCWSLGTWGWLMLAVRTQCQMPGLLLPFFHFLQLSSETTPRNPSTPSHPEV